MRIRDRSRCWLTPWTRVSSLLLAVALVSLAVSLDAVDSARAQSASPLSIQPQTGRVGIGTSAPAFTLDVAGTVNATGFRGDGSQLSNLSAASQWTTSGTSISYTAGRVGIGNAAPAFSLDVGGTVNATAFRGDGSQLTGVQGSSQWTTVPSGISYNGMVGIGTNAPSQPLHLATTSTDATLLLQASGITGVMAQTRSGSAFTNTPYPSWYWNTDWTSPGGAAAADGQSATINARFYSNYLTATNFGLSVPANATIAGIVAEVLRSHDSNGYDISTTDLSVRLLKSGVVSGADRADVTSSWPDTLAYKTYGGSSDLWGLPWAPADVNDPSFGVAVSLNGNNGYSLTSRVDHIRITVYYSATTANWSAGVAQSDGGKFKIANAASLGSPALFTLTQDGNVGIGTSTPASRLDVSGTLTATSKNFKIAHPLDQERKFLIHSALEGPEIAVYYRGEAQLVNGETTVVLPPYFEALTRAEGRTVQLTPIDGWSPLYVVAGAREGRFIVRTANAGNPRQRFYWEVKAVRADTAPLVVEMAKQGE